MRRKDAVLQSMLSNQIRYSIPMQSHGTFNATTLILKMCSCRIHCFAYKNIIVKPIQLNTIQMGILSFCYIVLYYNKRPLINGFHSELTLIQFVQSPPLTSTMGHIYCTQNASRKQPFSKKKIQN